ncbi:MAG: hypothetical protein ACK4Q5_08155 [Saprospiraceae bacterium]
MHTIDRSSFSFRLWVLACAILSVGLARCGVSRQQNTSIENRTTEALNQKMEPYDHRSQLLSWPDRVFDWRGYHQSLERAQAREAALRGANPCDGNKTSWKQEGPGNIGGRVNSLVIKPDDENVLLAGFSAGGIFKTKNKGDDWYPVFDDHLNLSIGDLTFDPRNPNTVYAGTGDPNIPGTVFNGSGIFKSTDAGETWSYLGLAEAGIISKVVVHPVEPGVLYAAAMGNPFVRDEHRGIYKSTDGGETWARILFVDGQAGASDLVINSANPNVLYASFWDRIRSHNESIVAGTHAAIYKTTNDGQTWSKLGGGLPTGVWGRTGLAMSEQDPQKIYAIYVDSLSRWPWIYKTTNGGTSWESLNTIGLHSSYGDFGWYFGKIRLNPTNDEELFFLAIQLWRKAAGTTQFAIHGGMHADVHDLVFAPSGTRYSATDGGVYRNLPGQGPWTRCKNLPTTQFYHVNFNKWKPAEWYGGAQDNGISSGNAQQFNGWVARVPNDGFTTQFHPWDQYNLWGLTQNGTVWKSSDGGDNWIPGQTCLGTVNDRCNWDTPFFVSGHQSSQFLFAASNRVYQSDVNGVPSWVPISGDLTDGNVYGKSFHTISCISESPLLPLKLMAGTSDGNVFRREPTGNWVNLTAGLPDRYVTSVHHSPTAVNRLYVTHAGWRNNERTPHIHRSDDNGATWVDISGDLPDFPVYDLLVLPGYADSVLICANDIGVYYSKNRGTTWDRLGDKLPNVPCFDLERNPVRKELGVGTYARGLWTFPLDSLFRQTESKTVGISGKIETPTAQGVGNVSVISGLTNSSGEFSAENLPGCQTYTVTPERNDNPLNGVSTFDLLLISKHILGAEPLDSPLKMLAADANRSRSITSFDILLIRKLILGIDTAIAGNKSWRFLPKNYVFKHPDNPLLDTVPESMTVNVLTNWATGLEFTGIKVGDVNWSATPGLNGEAEERGTFPLFFENQQFQPGETVEAVLSANLSDLNGLQFTLNFDPALLDFREVQPLLPGLSGENFGQNRTTQGLLTACFEPENQSLGSAPTPLFKVVFRAKKPGELLGNLRLNSNITRALAYESGAARTPVLVARGAVGQTEPTVVFAPTVFGKSGTTASVFVPTQASFGLQIVDNQGKTVFSKRENLPTGWHSFDVPSTHFAVPGSYFFKADVGGQAFSGKLIFSDN